MRFIDVTEGTEMGDLAINLDQIKYARYVGGILDLYFEGGSHERLTVQGSAATQVWGEIKVR